ncbi:MAG: relaxase/mobilization nuclease domain-containing protein [Eubacteriales bacterium]|nr:relaxase/mobilization nuclease domain-containing protein [Eubacteriales bacterium]
MAILKHIANKNADYGATMKYLLFEHNEKTMKPILDEKGRRVLRKEFLVDGVNCEPYSFDKECEIVNAKYHKNQKYSEIKSHHYIISFDPKDKDERGLTGEKAQALALEYVKRNFPGHQAFVCTHLDGHSGSGNIHTHVVINSVRKLDVPKQEFMERECDSRAGYKHHVTNDYFNYLLRDLMDTCIRENLHQIDLFQPAEKKVTDQEYKARRHGQENLDRLNEKIIADGLKPRTTVFQTQKDYLRNAIEDIASAAQNMAEFQNGLSEKYKITLTDKRGRFSYLHPERNKNISERALGTLYGKEHLTQLFEGNKKRETAKSKPQKEAPVSSVTQSVTPEPPSMSEKYPDGSYDTSDILFIKSDLHLVIDLQTCVKAQQSRAYARKVKISNLQEMAKTIAYVQEHGYDSRENLLDTYDDITARYNDARKTLRATESKLKLLNEEIHYIGQYHANKGVFAQMMKSRNKKKFQQEHTAELALYDSAVKYLKDKYPDKKIPSIKSLKEEKEKLITQKLAQTDTYNYFKEYQKELRTVTKNVDSILGTPVTRQAEKEKASDISK